MAANAWPNHRKVSCGAGRPKNIDIYLKQVQDVYVTDAYHSLSIEGYRVSPVLIERCAAARGTLMLTNRTASSAMRSRREAIGLPFKPCRKACAGSCGVENPGAVAEEDHAAWYREMFAPSVTAGLLRAADLAGYRNAPVYIRRSMHVPPNSEAVRDVMPVFFEMLSEETEPSVRSCSATSSSSTSIPIWTGMAGSAGSS